jgi:anaerobic dimethyl sulfoxide reductase subunit A
LYASPGTKVEFIAVQDNFLTPTARYADVVLPACTQFETWGVEDGWKYGDEVILQPKLVEPPGECKSDYRICADLAERLGLGQAYTEGRDEKAWVGWCLDRFRETRFPDLPSLETFLEQNLGAYSKPVTEPAIAFADFRGDPQKYPLNTPSGKIEIFSKTLYDMGKPEEIPAVPKYIPEWENPFPAQEGEAPASDPAALKKYPLQAIGHHSLARVHSTHDNNDWLQEAFPQRIFINPLDAAERDIRNGDLAHVWNDRGELVIPARLTPRILPGVVDIPQGAWWKPDANGVDRGG